MRKHLLWIIPLIALLITIFLYTSVPYFYRTWFNVRHALIYFIFAYIIVFGAYQLFLIVVKNMNNFPKVKHILVTMILLVVCTILYLSSMLQMKYIDLYEVPPLDSCSYYDTFGNFLYETKYRGCAEVVDYEETTDGIKITFVEYYTGIVRKDISVDGSYGYVEVDTSSTRTSTIEMEYVRKGILSSIKRVTYEIQEKSSAVSDVQDVDADIEYDEITIAYDENQISVLMARGIESIQFDNMDEVSLPLLSEIETETTTVTSKMYEENGETFIDIFELDDQEENIFVRGIYRNVNDPLFLLDFYEEGRFNGNSTDIEYDLNTITIGNTVVYNQSSGVESLREERVITFNSAGSIMSEAHMPESDSYTMTSFHAELNDLAFVQKSEFHFVNNTQYRMVFSDLESFEEVSVFYLEDYGYKVENYALKRYDNGSYYENFDKSYIHYDGFLYQFYDDRYYNYKDFIYYPGIQGEYHFYQSNPLLEGFLYFD
jgi:hypothetical protein